MSKTPALARRLLAHLPLGVLLMAIPAIGGVACGAAPPPACSHIALPAGAPRGDDDEALQRLIRSLRPGQTACLRSGAYRGDLTVSRADITIRSYPGEQAVIVGRLWFTRSAHDDVVSHVRLDGRNPRGLPSPTVNGARIAFRSVDVTDEHSGICFDIGSSRYGRALYTVIEHSTIHDCGALPANNTEHGIYVATADGTRILSNVIYHNADRGIQLYPDAQNTLIAHNVIDANGEGIIFSGASGTASSDNVVEHNLITNSAIRANVESWYPAGNPIGVGNVVRHNCLFGGHSNIEDRLHGFTATSNLIANPHYANPLAGDYAVPADSPCAKLLTG